MTMLVLAVCVAALLLAYLVAYFGGRLSVVPSALRHLLFLPFPIWAWLAVFLSSPPAKEGSQLGWFVAGLVMASPIIVAWCVGYLVGAMRDKTVETVVGKGVLN